jgi:hypothetical protein
LNEWSAGIGKGQTLQLFLTPENTAGIKDYKRKTAIAVQSKQGRERQAAIDDYVAVLAIDPCQCFFRWRHIYIYIYIYIYI